MSVHISAEKNKIAPVVLMPGDPLRARFIAENWLSEVELVSSTRNMFYFTGHYKGKRITIGGSGMGCASIGIYSWELFSFFDVSCIIRIGTAGSYRPDIGVYSLLNAEFACSESTYALDAFGTPEDCIPHQGSAFSVISETAASLGKPVMNAAIHSSDVFYRQRSGVPTPVERHGCVAVEMEAFALFANARFLNKSAATLLTVSDVIPTGDAISADQREKSLAPMVEVALESVLKLQ